jgi:hypothetical protein
MGGRSGCASFGMAVMAAAFLLWLPVSAQEVPASSPLGFGNLPIDFSTFLQGRWLRDLGLGKASVGMFVAGGTLRVDHTIAAGPNNVAAVPGLPDFDAFTHVRETPLRDGFVAFDGSLGVQDLDLIKVRFGTNIGRVTQFRQWTEPGVQQPLGWIARYAVGSVLQLPNNQEGIIYLDNRNRMWTWDVTARIPGFWGFDVLLEYKWNSIRSFLDPYSTNLDPLERRALFPNVGWRNNWRNAIPFTTSFTMTQSFNWSGPFIGLSWRNPLASWGGRAYMDVVASPLLFGKYEFTWGAEYNDGFFFVRGWQGTQIRGWDRIGLEWRGGMSYPVSRGFALDLEGKYTYMRLRGSDTEAQSMANNFLATTAYVQGAHESVTATQRFWQIGASVNFTF